MADDKEKRVKCPRCKGSGNMKIGARTTTDPANADIFTTCSLCKGAGDIGEKEFTKGKKVRRVLAFKATRRDDIAKIVEKTNSEIESGQLPNDDTPFTEEAVNKLWSDISEFAKRAREFDEIAGIINPA